jgi:hypothetical protein
MRSLTILCLVLLISAFAVGQAVVGGHATSGPVYGFYAGPFVPRIVTPSVSLSTVSPNPVGATNATYGNVAGATNSTLSIVSPPPVGVFTQPVFYDESTEAAPMAYMQNPSAPAYSHEGMARYLDYGVATFDSEISAAQLMAPKGSWKKASRTYTNADLDRLNQSTGTVKYDGKTEQIK